MNSLNTLYFPGTTVNSLRLYPIFLLFQKVHLLSPVEDPPETGDKESPDSFIKSGFCQVYTPTPLGQDRNRFLRLVADIKSGRDDYAAQLSSLTLAGMAGSPSRKDESERSIVRSLVGTQELPAEIQEKEEVEKLWQARLVLAIGELLDQEEEEIALNLAVIEDEEKVLFKELQGEDDQEEENPFAELSRLGGTFRGGSAGNVKNRFKAWKTLFLAGNIEDCPLFLTSGKENGDLLLDTFQQKTGQQAPLVASLHLPTFVGWNRDEASNTVHEFTTNNSSMLRTMEELFAELIDESAIAGQQLELANRQSSLSGAWENRLATDFPAERFGRIPVNFYLFPGQPCALLIGKTSATGTTKNGLLAIIG